VALAMAYRGLTAVPAATPIFQSEPLPLGTIHTFNVLNIDSITIVPIQAELQAVGDHAYFWIEQSPNLAEPSTRDLTETAVAFDAIYEQVIAIFGQEDSPGIDGDPRIHVVNAAPLTLVRQRRTVRPARLFQRQRYRARQRTTPTPTSGRCLS
jgi:hypothetical protein